MSNSFNPPIHHPTRLGQVGVALLCCAFSWNAHAAIIDQTVASTNTSTAWNSAVWGSPAAAPTSGNTYRVVAGTIASSDTKMLSGLSVTGRVRAFSGSTAFAGGSLEILSGAELLIKDTLPATFNANIVLNGGIIRSSPNTAGAATLTGTLNVVADSYMGVVHGGACQLVVNSTITGSSAIRLLGGDGGAHTIGFGGDLSAFTGTLDIGGGGSKITVDVNQSYNLGGASLVMRSGTADILNLDGNMTIGFFSFAGTVLDTGTYSIAALNSTFGNGSQFTGAGSLTIAAIPEPSTYTLVLGCVVLGAVSLRRFRRRTA